MGFKGRDLPDTGSGCQAPLPERVPADAHGINHPDACDNACPMRLQPRLQKRRMFTCTQCQQCVQACERVNRPKGEESVLQMVSGQCALDVSERDFGRRPKVPAGCFQRESGKER